MIGKSLVPEDLRGARRTGEPRAGDLVVDAPAHILRPGLAAVGPPGVLLGGRIHCPESADEADLGEQLTEQGARGRQKAGVVPGGPRRLYADYRVPWCRSRGSQA